MIPNRPRTQTNCLTCVQCQSPLVPLEWICMCTFPDSAQHCTLKPEHQIKYHSDLSKGYLENDESNIKLLKQVHIRPPEKKNSINILECAKCGEKISTIIAQMIGKDGKEWPFVCFRPEALYVPSLENKDVCFRKKGLKFRERKDKLRLAERLCTDYEINREEKILEHQSMCDFLPTNHPRIDNTSNINSLLERYRPPSVRSTVRNYQAEMYFQCLFQNSLIALPTGMGKTLIAILLMKKMLELNPQKLIAFVVTKIPLAFQQCQYIEQETGIPCQVLCSETKNDDTLQKLRSKEIKIHCFTDGMLFALIETSVVSPEDFSMVVFDEIHHGAAENHKFCKISKSLLKSKYEVKILGLTATPSHLEEILANFRITSISYPCIMRKEIEEIKFLTQTKSTSFKEQDEQVELKNIISKRIYDLNEQLGPYRLSDNIINHYPLMIGCLRNVQFPSHLREMVEHMRKLVSLIEITDILGSKYAIDIINKSQDLTLSQLKHEIQHVPSKYSPRYVII